INNTPVNFLPDSFTSAGIYDVTGFEFTFGNNQDSFTMNMNDRTLSVNGEDIDIQKSETSTTFQNFYNSFSVLIFTDTDVKATPDNSDPLVTVIYHTKDGTDVKVDFVDNGNDKCYVFRDDVYTGGLIDIAKINGKNSVRSFYDAFCEYAGIIKTVRNMPT
ncbi:MAG: hypothetical protein K2H26_05185, partial [Ruminococcus sp.]|nr:hypothetical protein [Ruminococcus sp.]